MKAHNPRERMDVDLSKLSPTEKEALIWMVKHLELSFRQARCINPAITTGNFPDEWVIEEAMKLAHAMDEHGCTVQEAIWLNLQKRVEQWLKEKKPAEPT